MAVNRSFTNIIAPAKLNLFLHILGRRTDGYHELQTLFQLLDVGDTLDFKPNTSNAISLSGDLLNLPPEKNLVFKAAEALRVKTGVTTGVDIHIHKNLPDGGGLGGGSSDAATTLLALNQMWELGLSLQELADIGVLLGADVPVFVHGNAAIATGVGEHLEPVKLPESHYLVIHPGIHVATAAVFQDKNLTRNSQAITLAAFLRGAKKNDCEQVVRATYNAVDKAMIWLSNYAKTHLTGTGACVFARFANKNEAQEVLADLPNSWTGFVATGLNQSPVHKQLGISQA